MLRLGIVRLADAAPYVMAGELGYFAEEGLRVRLSKELGWSTIKHKLAYGELDAVHALAPLPASLSLGHEVAATPCRALMVTSRLGNAITLSNRIRERGVRSADDFRQEVRSSRGRQRYTLGVVAVDSCHHFLMREWLHLAGLKPGEDLQIVVVPPGQALRNLRAGTLDGYCVGEPWNTLAVAEGIGWCPAISAELRSNHIEKVLAVREENLAAQPDTYAALQRALARACAFCRAKENGATVMESMCKKPYLGVTAQGLGCLWQSTLDLGRDEVVRGVPLIDFPADTSLSAEDVSWILDSMEAVGLIKDSEAQKRAQAAFPLR